MYVSVNLYSVYVPKLSTEFTFPFSYTYYNKIQVIRYISLEYISLIVLLLDLEHFHRSSVKIFQKISKRGLVGRIMTLPNKFRDGILKFYVDRYYTRVNIKSAIFSNHWKVDSVVRFDLNVWFDTAIPFEAVNIEVNI